MATQAQIKAAQKLLVELGFYNNGTPPTGAALAAQLRKEVDGDPQTRTSNALQRAMQYQDLTPNAELATAIATLSAVFDGRPASAAAPAPAAPAAAPATAAPAASASAPRAARATTGSGANAVQYDEQGHFIVRGRRGEWDTVHTIAQAWLRANPSHATLKTVQQVQDWIIRENRITDRERRDCSGARRNYAYIQRGPLTLPEGNRVAPFPLVRGTDCGPHPIPGVSVSHEAIEEITGVPLPRYTGQGDASMGIDGSVTGPDALNLPTLVGIQGPPPETAARGDNPNKPPHQTVGDFGQTFFNYTNVAAQLAGFAALGGPVTGALTQLGFGDRANRWMVAQQGSPAGQENNPLRRQWPLDGDPLRNPLSPNERERLAGTYLPGFQQIGADGRILPPPRNFAFQPNNNYQTPDGALSLTGSQRSVSTGGVERNKYFWGEPSAPQRMLIGTDLVQSQLVNDKVIIPRIALAQRAYDSAGSAQAKRAAAQELLNLVNFRSTLVFAVGNPLVQQETQQVRAQIMQRARQDRVTGLNEFGMDPATAITTISRAQLREQLVQYYTQMASSDESPRGFEFVYSRIVPADQQVRSPASENQRRRAAEQLVEHLPLVQSLPENGIALPAVARFVSRYDAARPNDVRHLNLNEVERGRRQPTQAANPNDPRGEMTAAMQLIPSNPGATEILLRGAGTNQKLAEALIQSARYMIDLPRDVGQEQHNLRFDRSAAMARVARLGFSQQTIQALYGSAPGYGQAGNHLAAIDPNLLNRARAEIAASANNPAVAEEWRQVLRTFSTDGVDDRSGIFPVGELQRRVMYAVATERPNRTMDALETLLGGPNGPEAQTLRRGVATSANTYMRDITGSDVASVVEYNRVVAQGQRGVTATVAPAVTAAPAISAQQAQSMRRIVTAASQGSGAVTMLQGIAASPDKGATAQQLLSAAAQFGEPQRQVLARQIITQLGSQLEAAGPQLQRMVQATRAGATLPAEDTSFVLNALAANSGETARAAIGAIANDSAASRILVGGVADNAALSQEMLGGLAPQARAGIDQGAAAAAPSARSGRGRRAAAPRDSGTGIVAAAAAVDANASAVTTANSLLENDRTRAIALRNIAHANPGFFQASILSTLDANPQLAAQIAEGLRKKGNERDTAWIKIGDTEQHALATLLQGYTRAGSAEEKARYASEINSYLQSASGGRNAARVQALQDLNMIVLGTNSLAVAHTIENAFSQSLAGVAVPLAGFHYTSADVSALAKASIGDGMNAATTTASAVQAWSNAFTTSATFQGLPFIVLPTFIRHARPRQQPPQQQTPPQQPLPPVDTPPPVTPQPPTIPRIIIDGCPPGGCTPVPPVITPPPLPRIVIDGCRIVGGC